MRSLYRAWWFLRRGFLLWAGYRTALLLSLTGSLVSLVQFGWTARFVAADHILPALAPYGGDLVAYFLVGSAFAAFVSVTLNAFSEHVRAEIQMGTLESLILADMPLPLLILHLVLWPFCYTLTNTTALFLLAVLLFRVSLDVHPLSLALLLILTSLTLTGVGLASAGILLVTKRGDPIHWVFTALTGLFAGVFYPLESVPAAARPISSLLPTTYALHGLRLALLRHAPPTEILSDLMALGIFCLVALPAGCLILHLGWAWARKTGTLAEY